MSSETTGKSCSATTQQSKSPDYDLAALQYAEEIGVIEYQVNGRYMEYWTFYGRSEGWYFVRYDLETKQKVFRGANIPWDDSLPEPIIPAFLLSETGATKYNYMQG